MIVCGTGHRPDKLGGYTEDVRDSLIRTACLWLDTRRAKNVELVISGGALGWDQALADAALELGIRLKLCLPFPGFEDRWPVSSREVLYRQLNSANEYEFVSDGPYAGYKMQLRNEAMVNQSDIVLALWNGTTGGTFNCIAYAKKLEKPIINLWDTFEELK